jgi:hypothetical protein
MSSDEVATSVPRDPCTRLSVLGTSFLVVLLGLGAPCAFSGEANSLERRLLEEAPSAWEAYDRFWLILQGSFSGLRVDREPTGTAHRSRSKFVKKQCSGFNLVQIEDWEDDNYSARVAGYNLRYHFVLTREQETKPWVISELKRRSAGDPTNPLARGGLNLGPNSTEVPMLIKSPNFKLLEVEPARENGDELVKVRFSYTPDEKNPLRGGSMLLDPQHDWVVRKGEATRAAGGKEFTSTIEYSYREGSNHHPILTQSRFQQTTKENNRVFRNNESVQDYDLREQETVPEKEFLLSAFGLPEPPGEGRATPWYLWLGGAGLACLVLGAIVGRLRHRAKAA